MEGECVTGRHRNRRLGSSAGVGERVLVIDEGNSARQVVKDKEAPLRSIIIGIVDHVDGSA